MMDHVLDRLQAYHDGELPEQKVRRVEEHLAQCEICRAELETLQAMSSLLQESPAASDLMRPGRFVAQVGLRLPRRPEQTVTQRVLETGWRLVPVGLLGAWAFVQTVLIVVSGILLAQNFPATARLFSSILPSTSGGSWLAGWQCFAAAGTWVEAAWCVVRYIGPLGWTIALSIVLFLSMALLYWSWLASWWVRHSRSHKAQTI